MDIAIASPVVPSTSTKARWAARIVTALPVLFLAMDSAMKLVDPPAVAEAMTRVQLSPDLARPFGALLAVLLALYVIRRTAPLGAVLLTGYLGGAVLTHVRIGDPLFTHTLFPIYVGAFLWAGLFLRDARVRNLVSH